MNGKVTDLMGVYVPTLGLILMLAFIVLLPLRWLLARLGVYGWFWHRGLVDLALLVMLSAALVFFVTY